MTWYKIEWYFEFLETKVHAVRSEEDVMEFVEAITKAGFEPTVEIYEGDYRPIPYMGRER